MKTTSKVSRNISEMSMESLKSPDSVKSFDSALRSSLNYSRGNDSIFSSKGNELINSWPAWPTLN